MVNLGQKLKILRLQHNLTQKQVAKRVGLAPSAISSYESGDRYPNYSTLGKLATLYRVSCDYLIGVAEGRTIDVTGLDEDEIEVISHTVELFRNKHSEPS